MAGIIPDEAENLVAKLVWKRTLTDRDADLEIGLFTNASVDETTTLAAITEPTGGGYARQDLPDASTTVTGGDATHPDITFIAVGGAMTGAVRGYFVATKAAGGTKRLVGIEVDPETESGGSAEGGYTLAEGAGYRIGLSSAVA